MPEKEFDLYLSLLARMLRLTEAQKASIADELSDHLEERFHELVEAGVSREDAIRRALDDVGDAAGLANSFTHLSRQSRRRRLMRISVSSAVVLLLAAWSAVTFWPQQPGGMPGKLVVAQAEQPSAVPPSTSSVPPANADAIRCVDPRRFLPEGLKNVVREERKDITLKNLVQLIRKEAGLDCLFDKSHLEEEGITGDETVTLRNRLPLGLSLDHALENVNGVPLTWRLDSGVVFITTQVFADTVLESRIFNVEPLLARGYRTVRNAARNDLVSVLEDSTSGIWDHGDETGGSIDVVGNVVIVHQTARCLNEVACVLEALNTPARMLWLNRPVEDQPILEALQSRCPGATFSQLKLSEFIQYVGKEFNIPVKLDHAHLAQEGITGDELVNLEGVSNQTLTNVLRWILADVNGVPLQAIVDRGLLTITPQSYACSVLDHALLDVSDLLRIVEPEIVSQLITRQTTGIWQEQGEDGEGGTATVTPDGRLLVRQTDRVLNEILELIPRIRKELSLNGVQPRDPQRFETRYYRLPHTTARDLREVIPRHIAPESWATLPGQHDRGVISLVAVEETWIPPTNPEGSGGGFFQLSAIGEIPGNGLAGPAVDKPLRPDPMARSQSVLVIRQTVAVHQQIQAFINEVVHGNPDGPPKKSPVPPDFFEGGGGFGGGIPSQVIPGK